MFTSPPRFDVNIEKLDVFGKKANLPVPGMRYHGEPLYCHVTFNDPTLEINIDEYPADNLDPQVPVPNPVNVQVTLTYRGPYDEPRTITWDKVSVQFQPIFWSIRLSGNPDIGKIYIEPFAGPILGRVDSDPKFQFVVVRDPKPGIDEPYKLYRIDNLIQLHDYLAHPVMQTVWPFDTRGGIIGPMGVLIDP
jgi:hypothetical protein